jgi:ferrochelatase
MNKTGVLLVNLGTPEKPTQKAVKRYLTEFLLDPRVIDLPWLKRQFLVRATIIPARKHTTTQSYQAIWTQEGSPLLLYGRRVQALLQQRLGPLFNVELAMRYQSPSLEKTIHSLLAAEIDSLTILPLFPQYASATTGSILEKTFQILQQYPVIPHIKTINSFATHPYFIRALAASAKGFHLEEYDHILMSFHGLPEKQLKKADRSNTCLKLPNCCALSLNRFCYSSQCSATAHALAKALDLSQERYTICFQSRLGRNPWMSPYIHEVIQTLAKQGAKNLLVFCPAFVADCLETLYEIGIELRTLFIHRGGKKLDLVPCLNDHPTWIDALERILK